MTERSKAGRQPERTAPDAQQGLDTLRVYSKRVREISEQQTELADQIDAVLGLARNPKVDIHSPLLVAALEQIGQTARELEQLSRRVAVSAVRDGAISRVEAGKRLGVHQATIARWLREADEPGPLHIQR